MLLGQVFQHILRSGDSLALAAAGRRGQAQIGEEHLAELLGRVDVEAPPGQLEDALADALQLDGEALGEPVQHAQIDAHAGLLHAEEHRSKLQIHLRKRARRRPFPLPLERGNQRMNRGGARGQCGGRWLRVARSHVGQRLRGVRGIERIRKQHGVVHRAAQSNALRGQQMQRGLPVVRLLGNGRIFKQCAKLRVSGSRRASDGSAQTPM